MSTTYADAGVHLSWGDAASKRMYEAAKETWQVREGRLGEVIVPFDDFSGIRGVDASQLPPGTLLNLGFDGVGTKVEIAERMGDHRTIAYDLFAMVCDDAVIRGAEPVLVGSILDLNKLDGPQALAHIDQLAEGYVEAARSAEVAVVNGEIAEMGARIGGYGDFHYNWGATVLWFAHRDRLLTGRDVRPGDRLIGCRERGFRSNGLSLMRHVLHTHYGPTWHQQQFQGQALGTLALHPSQIYSRFVVALTGGYTHTPQATLHAAAHITGGGMPGKLGRALKAAGCGATIDAPFIPAPLMHHCQDLATIQDSEAYHTWNMGVGMILVTPDPAPILALAPSFGIEAAEIGEVTAAPDIRIRSQGLQQPGQWLTFPPHD